VGCLSIERRGGELRRTFGGGDSATNTVWAAFDGAARPLETGGNCKLRIQQMQALSRQMIFGTLPDTRQRKRLTKKVLGLN